MITYEEALEYLRAGLSVLPAIRAEKHPAIGSWMAWQKRLPTEAEVRAWFGSGRQDALCIIAGAVSGNLECIDFDSAGELFPAWSARIPPELLDQFVIERSPSGGCHVLYRIGDGQPEGNKKLAQRMLDPSHRVTLIETRGERGLFLCAPSPGYELQQGSFLSLPVITMEERNGLLQVARDLDELPDSRDLFERSNPVSPAPVGERDEFVDRPGDDYNARGNFRELLTAHGWTLAASSNGNEYWRRPGKSSGQSASFNGEVFYVFSSNAYPFEPERGYTPFQAYTLLEHGGNFGEAARELLDAGFGETEDPTVGVDLSNLSLMSASDRKTLEQKREEKKRDSDMIKNPGPLPDRLMDVPGFVNSLAKYTMETAPYPNRVLAFTGALSMLSMLTGQKYTDAYNSRTNIYLVSLAESGTGKDHPRKTNFKLAAALGLLGSTADSFASGEGLEDAIMRTPAMLFMTDEFDSIFNNLKIKDSRAESINATMLKLYSESNGFHCRRVKAFSQRKGKVDIEDIEDKIENPHLVLFGTAVPQYFYEALSRRVLENGLIARCIILEAGPRGKLNRPIQEDLPDDVLTYGAYFRDYHYSTGGDLERWIPKPFPIPESEAATALFEKAAMGCDEESDRCERRGDVTAMSLWRRGYEKVRKLAMLHTLSRKYNAPLIDEQDVQWAWDLVDYFTRKMLYTASLYVHDSQFDELAKKILRTLERNKGMVSHSKLLRNSHVDKDAFRRVIETLIESNEIMKDYSLAGQRGALFYRLIK